MNIFHDYNQTKGKKQSKNYEYLGVDYTAPEGGVSEEWQTHLEWPAAVFEFKDAFCEKFGPDFCSSVFRVPLKAAYLDQKGETLRSSIVVDRVVTPLRKRLERQKVRVGGGWREGRGAL